MLLLPGSKEGKNGTMTCYQARYWLSTNPQQDI
jgi:hypothetical protein